LQLNKEIFETIYFGAVDMSCTLAASEKERDRERERKKERERKRKKERTK
jgi:hypothetical protein